MISLTDKSFRENLFPFTHTRHAADIRIGILTIKQKWELLLGQKVNLEDTTSTTLIPASIIPTLANYKTIIETAKKNDFLVESEHVKIISFPWHIFQLNDYVLRQDYLLLTQNKTSALINDTVKVLGAENIFVHDKALLNHCILNATTGPIYIDEHAQIMEGSTIRGPFYLGQNSIVKMGAKIYGATTIGPNCVVGGEIKNSVIFGNTNKAHDGYLGDSVVGEWCNLGAGTSNSNVKNTGGNIGYMLEQDTQAIYAGNKGGLLMADYSRAAINTAFNTGTVVGVSCNVFGSNMPAKYIDNFTWGNEQYLFDKVIVDIDNWKKMKGKQITNTEIDLLKKLYENTN